MVELQINTTQNVNINFTAASLGNRILAFIIDYLIIVSYVVISMYVIGEMGVFEMEDYWSKAAIIGIIQLPAMFYTLISEYSMNGQTLGKKALSIKVVKIDGYQATFLDYLTRWLFRIIDIYMAFSTGGVAILSIALSEKSQRLGDMAAGTGVISIKNLYSIDHTILENIGQDYSPTYPTVIQLSDKDVQIIKDIYRKAIHEKDHKTLIKLRLKVEELTKTSRGQLSDTEYLNVIIKDYTHLTQHM